MSRTPQPWRRLAPTDVRWLRWRAVGAASVLVLAGPDTYSYGGDWWDWAGLAVAGMVVVDAAWRLLQHRRVGPDGSSARTQTPAR